MDNNKVQKLLDRLAIMASIGCALHCIALPVLLVVFPALMSYGFLGHELHETLLFIVLPTSLLAFYMGYSRHRNMDIVRYGIVSLVLMMLIPMIGHEILGDPLEATLTVVVALSLSFFHLRNLRLPTLVKSRV